MRQTYLWLAGYPPHTRLIQLPDPAGERAGGVLAIPPSRPAAAGLPSDFGLIWISYFLV